MKNPIKITASLLTTPTLVGMISGSAVFTPSAKALSTDYLEETFDPTFGVWSNVTAVQFRCEKDDARGNYAVINCDNRCLAKRKLSKMLTSGIIHFEMEIKVSATDTEKRIYWENSNGFHLRFGKNYLEVQDGKSGARKGAEVTPEKWHHILIVCDLNKGYYELYLDHAQKPYLTWNGNNEPASLQTLVIRVESQGGYFAFDNVRVYDPLMASTPEMEEIASYTKVLTPEDIEDSAAIAGRVTKIYPDTNDTAYEYPVYILGQFGIMNGESAQSFGVGKNITAGEFLDMVKKAFGVTKFATPIYAQLSANPAQIIKETQALAIILSALGYDGEALAAGGYPAGYRDVGNRLCVSRGLNIYSTGTATRGIVAMMMYYALGTEIKSTGATLYDKYRPSVKPALSKEDMKYLLQDNFYYRVEAYNVLRRRGVAPVQITDALLNLLENGTKEQKKRAARALSDNQQPQGFFDHKSRDLYVTLNHLGLSSRMVTNHLLNVLKDEKEDVGVRIYALRALWMMHVEELIPMQYWTLALHDETTRYHQMLLNIASDRLEMTNTAESVDALIKALNAPDREVVLRSTDTLNRKGLNVDLRDLAKAAIPALKRLLKNPDSTIAHQAAVALNTLGAHTPLPKMIKARQHGQSGQAVKVIKISETEYAVDNGIFEVKFNGSDRSAGGFSSLKMHGSDVNIVTGSGFLTWDHAGGSATRKVTVAEQTDDYVEVSTKILPEGGWTYSLDFRFRIVKGESKIYNYIVLEQDENGEGTKNKPSGIRGGSHMRINNAMYDYFISSEKMVGARMTNPAYNVTPAGAKASVEQATDLGASGEVEGKFLWWQGGVDTKLWGHVSKDRKLGLWQLFPSYDSFDSNNLRMNLNEITSDMSSISFVGQYFNWDGFKIPAGKYTKIYGPYVWYINTGDSMIDMMEDAKAEFVKEEKAWPYKWLANEHFHERGDAVGKVEMEDGTSAKGAYVIINVYSGRKGDYEPTWQQNAGPYGYWTRISNDDGTFEIKNLHAGEYNITVFKDGYVGTLYLPDKIMINRGRTTDIGSVVFKEEVNGSLAWRIGIPDGTWLFDAEDVYDYETLISYRPRFPLDAVYNVDEADDRYDWSSNHHGTVSGESKSAVRTIVFNKDAGIDSDALLTFATGSARASVTIGLTLNGKPLENIVYQYGKTDDSMNARTFAYGRSQHNKIKIDKSLLVNGQNKLEITISNRQGHFLYDFVQLEYLDGTNRRLSRHP